MASYQPDPGAVARAVPARLGRYELLGQLATGGMAEIHLARLGGEAGFEKIVVVKRLLPELVASPAFVAMFLDEGKLVARLDHPNVCEVHELGRDGVEYFLAMPYLDGVSVHELIARPREPDRRAELAVCAGVIAQACAGLHHAHELRDADGTPAGLVHRDVSPSNLFVTVAGVVKVLDFGIAKVRGAAETAAGTIKGKSQYMAPEQLLGEPLDRRCDVFALGIVMFELATHQRLFKRASEYLTARAILDEPIPRADEVDPAIPAPLADVIATALARDRAARYADAAAMARAIEAAMAGCGGIAGAAAIAAAVVATEELTAQRTRQARVLAEARSARSEAGPQEGAAREGDGEPHARGAGDATARERAAREAGASRVADAPSAVTTRVAIARRRDGASQSETADGGDVTSVSSVTTQVARASDRDGSADVSSSAPLLARGGRRRWIGAAVVAFTALTAAAVVIVAASRRDDEDQRAATVDARAAQASVDASAAAAPGAPGASNSPRAARGSGAASDASAAPTGDHGSGAAPDADGASVAARGSGAAPAHGSRVTPARGRDEPPSRARAPGRISIDSTPFATIYLDGKRLDVTPILGHRVAAGRHVVRAVLADGRSREVVVEVPAGRAARPLVLTW